MNMPLLSALLIVATSCQPASTRAPTDAAGRAADSLALVKMIAVREQAMITKDLPMALAQFAEDATWINSQGYYFEGKSEVANFHRMLAGNDSRDYYYEAGVPLVRIVDPQTALAYYSWKMYWYRTAEPTDTTMREIGLMTLLAHKSGSTWQWIAVTNQHTPEFYERIDPVTIE